jgi:hypothetical protein
MGMPGLLSLLILVEVNAFMPLRAQLHGTVFGIRTLDDFGFTGHSKELVHKPAKGGQSFLPLITPRPIAPMDSQQMPLS